MGNRYAVAMEFSLIDGVSKKLDAMMGKGKAFGGVFAGSLNAAEQRVAAFGRTVKVGVQTAMWSAATIGVSALASAVKSGAEQFIDLDNAITSAGAMFKDLDPTSNTFRESLDALQQTALDVAGKTEFMATDTAGALQKMAMAGMTAQQSMELLMGTTNLATAAGTDLTTAVDIATDALGAFSLDATAENLQRVSDVMAKTTTTANTSLEQMFEALKMSAPNFTTAGQSVETLAASIGVLANAGTKGSQAGTGLRALITQLSSTAKTMGTSKSLGLIDYGINVKDAEGNFLPLFEIIDQIDKVTSKMGSATKSEFLYNFFGKQGSTAINELLAATVEIDGVIYKGIDALKAYQVQLEGCGGAAELMADTMRGSLKNQIELLKSAVSTLEINFVKAFKDKGSDAIQKLTDIVNSIDVDKLVDAADRALNSIINLGKTIWNLRTPLMVVGGAILAFRGAMDAIVIGSKVAGSIKMITESVQGLKIALAVLGGNSAAGSALAFMSKGVQSSAGMWTGLLGTFAKLGPAISGAFASLGAALAPLLANPITWVVLGIAAAVAAVVAIMKNWGTISEKLQNSMGAFGRIMYSLFAPAVEVTKAMLESAANFLSVTFGPIIESVKNVIFSLWENIKAVGEVLGTVLKPILEVVAGVVGGVFAVAWTALSGILMGVFEVLGFIGNIVGTVVSTAFNSFASSLDIVTAGLQNILGAFSNGGFLAGIKAIGGAILSFLLSPIQTLLDMISLIPGVGNLTSGLAESLQAFRESLVGIDNSGTTNVSQTPTLSAYNQSVTSNYSENVQRSEVTIGLEKGLTATPSYGAPPIVMERVRTGAF